LIRNQFYVLKTLCAISIVELETREYEYKLVS